MLSTITAAAGRLLISEPFMMDPNFKRSVILLTEYTDEGAVGFILNHSGEFLLGDILPEVSYSEIPVYTGGPVATNGGSKDKQGQCEAVRVELGSIFRPSCVTFEGDGG